MNKLIIWLISLFYFVSILIVNSYAQDTITINKGFLLSNIVLNYSSDSIYTDIELLNDDYRISGYLFIQLDSNTKYNLAAKSPNEEITRVYINPTIYFIHSRVWEMPGEVLVDSALERMECDTCRIYQLGGIYSLDLVRHGRSLHNNGKRDDLTNFLYYYAYYDPDGIYYFGRVNQMIRTDSLSNKIAWTKDDDKISYIIFKTDFRAALLKFKTTQKKFVLPTSTLNYFQVVDPKVLLRQGFKKSKTVITVR